MHFESYYVNPDDVRDDHLILIGDDLHHLSRVKRKKVGDFIQVVDGQGHAYKTEIMRISKTEAQCQIKRMVDYLGEPNISLTVVLGALKGDRFDWFVEKATEIGVSRIIPLICERTVSDPGPQKIKRWRRIVQSAMKQCGRSMLPEVTEPHSLKQTFLLGSAVDVRLIAHADDSSRPLSIPLNVKSIMILVGPEGGFTDKEALMAQDHGFRPVSLGSRRLRAETAGIVFLTQVMSHMKELE